MNSFTLTAIGNLARDPEQTNKGDTNYTRFCLIGNDYAGKDERGEITTSLWFVAFGSVGQALAKHARKGDQLILQAQLRNDAWTDKEGQRQEGQTLIVQSFRFGAPGRVSREAHETTQAEA